MLQTYLIVISCCFNQIAKEVCGCFRLCDGLHEAELNEKISQYTKANTKNCQQGSDQEQDMVIHSL